MHEIYKQVLSGDPNTTVEETLAGTQVLFADEDHEMLAVIRAVVNELGWTGYYVHSAVEIIEKVNELQTQGQVLDAVVAEINYLSGPTLTGITAAREIRKAMPDVPIVFLSSYVTTSMVREEIRRVDATFLAKPFDVTQLFIRLSKLVYWYKLTQGQYGGNERRATSFNASSNFRRASDYVLSTPTRIQQTLSDQEEDKL